MKKMTALILTLLSLQLCTACSRPTSTALPPQLSQMRNICELSVFECYYHNVAKTNQENADPGFLGIGKKDLHFWVEYSGIVEVGVDASLLAVDVNGTHVTVTIPEARVLGCKVDSASLTKDSYIVAKGSAAVKGADEVAAVAAAEKAMQSAAAANTALLNEAQQRAQLLMENYISNIGNALGMEYTIEWKFIDDPNPSNETLPAT